MGRQKSDTEYLDLIKITSMIRYAKKIMPYQSVITIDEKEIKMENIEIDVLNKRINIKT